MTLEQYHEEDFVENETNTAKNDTGIVTPTRSLYGDQFNWNTPSKRVFFDEDAFPSKHKINGNQDSGGASIEKNINRSARKKSAKRLIERLILENTIDSNDDDEELAEHIFNSDDDSNHENLGGDLIAPTSLATPKKSKILVKKKESLRSGSPMRDINAHEIYFYSNKGGHSKTSNNSLSTFELLDHEEYFSRSRKIKEIYEDEMRNLELVHLDKFNQWQFELIQDFNLCLYGFGSKRSLLSHFADYIYKTQRNHEKAKVVVVNGHVSTLTIRDIFKTIASAITTEILKSASPADMLDTIFDLLDQDKSLEITLIVHSIDGYPLRRLVNQNILSRLGAHSQIHLVASADHPLFPLLWDSSLRSMFNFVFHDCTTFQAYNTEIDVVEEVHELFGRIGRRMGGKDGVSFVLKSLPENAKKLFGILVRQQLKAIEESSNFDLELDDENKRSNNRQSEPGIEYRVLYQKSVEEFICSNEINFRTLLKEFHDHQMIQSKKDTFGTEILTIPFNKEELETILENIMS